MRRRLPEGVGWALALVASYLLGGIWLGVPCAVLGLACMLLPRPPSGRTFLVCAAVLMASVPLVFLVSTAPMWGQVSASLIVDHPYPHRLAACALLLLAIGVVRDEHLRSDKLGADD